MYLQLHAPLPTHFSTTQKCNIREFWGRAAREEPLHRLLVLNSDLWITSSFQTVSPRWIVSVLRLQLLKIWLWRETLTAPIRGKRLQPCNDSRIHSESTMPQNLKNPWKIQFSVFCIGWTEPGVYNKCMKCGVHPACEVSIVSTHEIKVALLKIVRGSMQSKVLT